MNASAVTDLLSKVCTLIGSASYYRNKSQWEQYAAENFEALSEAAKDLESRLALKGKPPITNPGGWLHRAYEARRAGINPAHARA